jgi:hypothetical protein
MLYWDKKVQIFLKELIKVVFQLEGYKTFEKLNCYILNIFDWSDANLNMISLG